MYSDNVVRKPYVLFKNKLCRFSTRAPSSQSMLEENVSHIVRILNALCSVRRSAEM
jgi:hypothetical protein